MLITPVAIFPRQWKQSVLHIKLHPVEKALEINQLHLRFEHSLTCC